MSYWIGSRSAWLPGVAGYHTSIVRPENSTVRAPTGHGPGSDVSSGTASSLAPSQPSAGAPVGSPELSSGPLVGAVVVGISAVLPEPGVVVGSLAVVEVAAVVAESSPVALELSVSEAFDPPPGQAVSNRTSAADERSRCMQATSGDGAHDSTRRVGLSNQRRREGARGLQTRQVRRAGLRGSFGGEVGRREGHVSIDMS